MDNNIPYICRQNGFFNPCENFYLSNCNDIEVSNYPCDEIELNINETVYRCISTYNEPTDAFNKESIIKRSKSI